MRCTDRKLTPAAFASIRPVQWVASPGGIPSARSTTRCTVATGSGFLPGLRVLSRISPATPSAMNRACHRHTTGFDLPGGTCRQRGVLDVALERLAGFGLVGLRLAQGFDIDGSAVVGGADGTCQ